MLSKSPRSVENKKEIMVDVMKIATMIPVIRAKIEGIKQAHNAFEKISFLSNSLEIK